MGKLYDTIDANLSEWIAKQRLFFVATAPLSGSGHVNCSPKGLDSFRILGPQRVGYLDLTGSGAETIAHLRENGRINFMFCAFEGPPRILRLHGRGNIVTPEAPEWASLRAEFPGHNGERSIVLAEITRIADSCGFGVPKYEHVEDRETMEQYALKKGPDGLAAYRAEKNAESIDGLRALG